MVGFFRLRTFKVKEKKVMANSAINISANAQEVINLRKRIDELKAALSSMRRSTDPAAYDKLNRELQTSSIRYNRLVGDLQRYVSQQQQAERATRGTESSMSNMQKMLLQIGGTTALIALGKQVIDVRAEMQMLEQSFDVLLGGKDVSNFMSQLKQFAVDSPLSLTGVANAAQTLLGFNVEADKTIPIIKQIGDISMGNEERFKSLTLAFAQMSATGKLMGQDLLQMINAGFNPLQEISSKTGKSIADLKKEMENGSISSQMVADAFASATAQGGRFYGMTEKQAQGVKGLQAQLEGGLQDAFNEIGQSQEGIIAGGYKMSISLVENYDKVGKALIAIVSAYGVYKAALVASIALERVKTTVAVYDIATKQLQLGLTLKNIAAQLALNKAILANPYALAASLIVGLVVATWALYDATTTQEKAQKRLNEINEETKKQKEELSGQTEQLIGTINAETKSKLDQIIAYKELQGLFPAYLKNMDLATFKAMKLADQQALLNNAMNENETNNLNNQLKELQSMYDRLNSTSGNGFGGLSEGVKVIDEIREKLKLTYDIDVPTYLKTQIDLLRKQRDEIQKNKQEAEIRNKPEAEQIKYINEQLDILNKKKSAIEEIATKAENLPTPFQKMALKARDALSEILGINNEISRLQNWLGAVKGTTGANYQQSYKDAEKNYKDAQKAVASIKKDSKATVDEYNKAIAAEKKAKEDFEKLGGQTKVDKSGESKAKRAKELANDEAELRKKLANEALQAELDYEQAVLDAKEDSYDKQFKLNDLNYRKEIQKIKEYNDQKLKEQADFIEKFGKSVELPEELKTEFIDIQVNRKENQARSSFDNNVNNLKKQQQKELFDDALKEYRTFEEKQNEIALKYIDLRAKATESGNLHLIENLNKAEQKEMSALNLEDFKEKINWEQVFGDLDKVSTNALKELRDRLREYLLSAGDSISIQDLKAVSEAIDGIDEKLANKTPLTELKDGYKEYKEAVEKVKTAKEELNKLEEKDPLFVKAKKELTDAELERAKSLSKITKSINDIGSKGSTIVGVGNDVVNMLESFGVSVSDQVKKTLSGIGQVMEGLESIDLTKPFTAVTGTIKTLTGVGQTIGGLFGNKNKAAEDTKRLQDVTEKVSVANDAINSLLEKRIELIKESTAAERQHLSVLTNESLDAYQDYYDEQFNRLLGNDLYGKKGKNNNLSVEDVMKMYGLSSPEDFAKWWQSGGYGALTLQGYDLRDKDKYDSWASAYMDMIDKRKELAQTMDEEATQISFDSFRDSFLDTLSDMDSSSKDFAENFEGYLQKAMLNSLLNEKYQDRINNLYSMFSDYNADGNIDESEYKKLQDYEKQLTDDMIADRDKLKKSFGWDSSSSQSSSYGTSTSMDQETGGAILGRLTGVHEELIGIGQNVGYIAQWNQPMDEKFNVDVLRAPIDSLNESCQRIELMMEENRNIALQTFYVVKDIKVDTSNLSEINDKLGRIENNTKAFKGK